MTAAPSVVWRPNPGAQMAFLSCPVFEVLLEGNRGGGKTESLLIDFAREVGRGFADKWIGVLFRHTYKQLSDVIDKSRRLFKAAWPQAVFHQTGYYWLWPTGEKLLLRHFERDADYDDYHGHAYPWQGWEELTTWATPTGYKRMMSTCRSDLEGVPRRVRATCNPHGRGHNWIRERFRLPAWRSRIITDSRNEVGDLEPPRVAIFCPLSENRPLLDADPDYLQRVRAAARNESERKAWEEGSWDIISGGMFDDVWEPRVHVIEPFAIPGSWRIVRTFDWGSSAPFSVGWWAKSDGSVAYNRDGSVRHTVRGDVFRIGEWYGWKVGHPNEGLRMLATDIARGIIERERILGIEARVQPGPADSSIFDFSNGSGIADDMSRPVRLPDGRVVKGPEFVPADKSPGSRHKGWDTMRRLMRDAKPNADGTPRERPGFFLFSHCDQFQRTVPVLPRDEKDPDDVDTAAEDHIADECVVGETLVVTFDGAVPIRDLVGREGLVLSRCGSWSRYVGARQTLRDVPVVRLTFSDGSIVTCTPDHPFLTTKGWLPASAMAGESCYNGVAQRIRWSKEWSWPILSSSRRRVKSLMASATTFAARTFSVVERGFIELFGQLGMAQFQEAPIFTTSTKTGQTTESRTSNSCRRTSTYQFTIPESIEACPLSRETPRECGTGQPPDISGTKNSTSVFATGSRERLISRASLAEHLSAPRTSAQTDSVPTTARLRAVVRLALTIRNVAAWFAAAALLRIATMRRGHAAGSVLECLSVEPAGRSDVFCLTVPGTDSFCVAGGLVVHNTRYYVLDSTADAGDVLALQPEPRVIRTPRYVPGGRSWMG